MGDPVDAAIAASEAAESDQPPMAGPFARAQFLIASQANPTPRHCAFEIPTVLSLEEEAELVKSLVMVLHQMRPHRPKPSGLVLPR